MQDIVKTKWEDKDIDLIVQYLIDKKLKLESVDELTCSGKNQGWK